VVFAVVDADAERARQIVRRAIAFVAPARLAGADLIGASAHLACDLGRTHGDVRVARRHHAHPFVAPALIHGRVAGEAFWTAEIAGAAAEVFAVRIAEALARRVHREDGIGTPAVLVFGAG